jgi:thiol-disulfide isomerase/thioredoxin
MKFKYLLIFLLVNTSIFAQGIAWEPTIDAAIKKAKATNKPLFVECYHPNCPVCMSLEPTFKNTEVGKFYNANFVNYKLNLSDANQVKYLDKKRIRLPGFPLFLFMDKDEKILHTCDPINSPEGFVNHAKTALNPDERTGDMKRRYEAGEKNVDLLIGLSYLTRITLDTATNLKAANDLFEIYPKDQLGSETSWQITKKCITDVENGFTKYWFDHINDAAQIESRGGHAGNEMNALGAIVQSSLFSPRALKYSTVQVNLIKEYMNRLGAGPYIAANTWQVEIPALIRENRVADAINLANTMATQFSGNGQALVYVTRYMTDNTTDNQYFTTAKGWIQKAKPLLKENKDLVEYYYESARLHKRGGDAATAKKDAIQGKTLATTAKLPTKRFDDLIATL